MLSKPRLTPQFKRVEIDEKTNREPYAALTP